MEEASKRNLSATDRFNGLLQKHNNDLVELLLGATANDNVLSSCLSREFEVAWKKQWIKESKNPDFITLIPSTCTPPFFGAAISILNNRGKTETVIKYLEIFAAAPYHNFHAQKALTKHYLLKMDVDKENTGLRDQLFALAHAHAKNAAHHHRTPGYFLLAYLHYCMAQREEQAALMHYELSYQYILTGEKLTQHSDDKILAEPSESTFIREISDFFKTTIFTPQRVFEKKRAESTAATEATKIIESGNSSAFTY